MKRCYRVVKKVYPSRTVFIVEQWDEKAQLWKMMSEHGEYENSVPAIAQAQALESLRIENTPITEEVVWE